MNCRPVSIPVVATSLGYRTVGSTTCSCEAGAGNSGSRCCLASEMNPAAVMIEVSAVAMSVVEAEIAVAFAEVVATAIAIAEFAAGRTKCPAEHEKHAGSVVVTVVVASTVESWFAVETVPNFAFAAGVGRGCHRFVGVLRRVEGRLRDSSNPQQDFHRRQIPCRPGKRSPGIRVPGKHGGEFVGKARATC